MRTKGSLINLGARFRSTGSGGWTLEHFVYPSRPSPAPPADDITWRAAEVRPRDVQGKPCLVRDSLHLNDFSSIHPPMDSGHHEPIGGSFSLVVCSAGRAHVVLFCAVLVLCLCCACAVRTPHIVLGGGLGVGGKKREW